MMDAAQTEPMEGYPSFVRWRPDTGQVNWWAPVRLGQEEIDFATGRANLQAALGLFNGLHDRSSMDFAKALSTPGITQLRPASVLAKICDAMPSGGPIERGFLTAMAEKAGVGRPPPIVDRSAEAWFSEDDRYAEEYAHACIEFARQLGTPQFLTEEIISVIDRTFANSSPAAFLWTVCVAAAAGALN